MDEQKWAFFGNSGARVDSQFVETMVQPWLGRAYCAKAAKFRTAAVQLQCLPIAVVKLVSSIKRLPTTAPATLAAIGYASPPLFKKLHCSEHQLRFALLAELQRSVGRILQHCHYARVIGWPQS